MNLFLLLICLCIFINENAESEIWKCSEFYSKLHKNKTYLEGLVCANISCNSSVDPTCKIGTWSKVLRWETDIFEVGFTILMRARRREIVVRIDLNKDNYMEIETISDKHKRTVKIILNECSHTKNDCLENQNFTHRDVDPDDDETHVAIGFRKDKKINFFAVSEEAIPATKFFGEDNEFELKMDGFYFNTNETMKITFSSSLEEDYDYDALAIFLPTSVGGMFFYENGYLLHDNFWCKYKYNNNSNDSVGLPYIIKEYFNNSENWRANPVKFTKDLDIPHFNENGMQFKREQMFVKKEKNPNFDEKKMMREGCKYVAKPESSERTTKKVTPAIEPPRLKDPEESDGMKQFMGHDTPQGSPLSEDSIEITLPEITIANVNLVKKTDTSEQNINLEDFFNRVGKESIHEDYFKTGGKGGDKYKVILPNNSWVNLKNYKYPKSNVEKKKSSKKTKQSGSGGAGGKAQEAQEAQEGWRCEQRRSPSENFLEKKYFVFNVFEFFLPKTLQLYRVKIFKI